ALPVMSGVPISAVKGTVTTCVSVPAEHELSVAFSVYLRTSVSPCARKLNAPLPDDPLVNVQVKSEPADGLAPSAPDVTAIIAFRAAFVSGLAPPNVLDPSTATLSTVIVTVSDRSTSTTLSDPFVVSVVSVSVRPADVALPVMS